MLGAAQAAGAGNLPAEVERMIKEFTEPKMNWREILQQQIQSTIKNDFTFQRPSNVKSVSSSVVSLFCFFTNVFLNIFER